MFRSEIFLFVTCLALCHDICANWISFNTLDMVRCSMKNDSQTVSHAISIWERRILYIVSGLNFKISKECFSYQFFSVMELQKSLFAPNMTRKEITADQWIQLDIHFTMNIRNITCKNKSNPLMFRKCLDVCGLITDVLRVQQYFR